MPDAIAITHWHLDHCGDLIPWAWLNAYSPEAGKNRPELWLPPGSAKELETFTSFWGVPRMWERAFELREYAPSEPFEAAGFTVEAIQLPHYAMQAFGFRVRDPERGRVLAYSGDSAPTDELADARTGRRPLRLRGHPRRWNDRRRAARPSDRRRGARGRGRSDPPHASPRRAAFSGRSRRGVRRPNGRRLEDRRFPP